jgi:HEPN domain-containing protein
MKPLTREWVEKAEADFAAANTRGLSTDIVCFHSQQTIEKYLKGYLHENDLRFPKTHDLEELLDLCLASQPLWEAWRKSLSELTEYAAEFRYPGEWATDDDARNSIKIATEFRKEIRSALRVED